MGRENKMMLRLGATWVAHHYQEIPRALDYNDKMRREEEALFQKLTVQQLVGFIDQTHLDLVR
jgi:hypothetical protein